MTAHSGTVGSGNDLWCQNLACHTRSNHSALRQRHDIITPAAHQTQVMQHQQHTHRAILTELAAGMKHSLLLPRILIRHWLIQQQPAATSHHLDGKGMQERACQMHSLLLPR